MNQPAGTPPLDASAQRPLGKTGVRITRFGLGGEGVLRTHDRLPEARAVIERALDLGVTYFDSARAYAGSEGYYGATLGRRRDAIFLTSKAFERSRKKALQQLDETLRTMRVDHLDLWQMHDMRYAREIDEVCAPDGALEAFREAREQGKVRFLGVTGHFDPAVLSACLDVFDFDTVLLPVNPTEAHGDSFVTTTLQKAVEKELGIIAMKVPSRGYLLQSGVGMEKLMNYAWSHPVSTVIVGCDTPAQVEHNVRLAAACKPMQPSEMRHLEEDLRSYTRHGQFFKKWQQPRQA